MAVCSIDVVERDTDISLFKPFSALHTNGDFWGRKTAKTIEDTKNQYYIPEISPSKPQKRPKNRDKFHF